MKISAVQAPGLATRASAAGVTALDVLVVFRAFLETQFQKPDRWRRLLVAGIADAGVNSASCGDADASIESHTISHRDLRGRKNRRATAEYEEWLWKELAGSKEQLEEQLGISVEALALPYGRHDEHVREIAKKAGYEVVFTVEGQKITYATPLDSVGRYIIDSSKPKVFAEAIRFGGPSDDSTSPAVAAIDFSAIETQPPNGAKVSEEFPLLKANLAPFGNIDPKSVQMRISGIGLVAAEDDAASKSVSFKLKQNLQEKDYIVIVSMQADSRRLETRWSFTLTRVKGED